MTNTYRPQSLCEKRTLAERWSDAVMEVLALDTYRRSRREGLTGYKPIGRTRNWPRILDWHGTSPRARYNYGRWKQGKAGRAREGGK